MFFIKEYAKGFYKSKAWQRCREGYAASVGGLCERCVAVGEYRPGEIVHHKIHITPDNIGDPTVTLNWNNLELVCRECHNKAHSCREGRRYTVGEDGRISPL